MEESIGSAPSELECAAAFAKLSLNCKLLPVEKLPDDYAERNYAHQLEYAESYKLAGKHFKYSLFDTADPGGISVDETNQADLRTLNPRLE